MENSTILDATLGVLAITILIGGLVMLLSGVLGMGDKS